MNQSERGMSHPIDEKRPEQIEAIRQVMQIFLEDDMLNGVTPDMDLYCDPCEEEQPAMGAIEYGNFTFCNPCAVEYELFRLNKQPTAENYVNRRKLLNNNSAGEIPLTSCEPVQDSI